MPSFLPTTPNDELASNFGLDGFPGVDFGKGIRDRPGRRPQPPVSGKAHLPGDVPPPESSAEDTLTAALRIAARSGDGEDYVPRDLVAESLSPLDIHIQNETPQLSRDLVGGNAQAPLEIDFSNESTAFEIQSSDTGLRGGQGMIHHEWLQATQDPARLPQLNNDNIQNLEALWGGVTTGHEVRAGALRELLQVAMRRSAQGEALSSIQAKLETLARASWPKVKTAFNRVAAEHGLHGPLYLRASAFPGLHRGKHAGLLRKLAAKARYLVGGDPEAATALGLRFVAHVRDIPWEKELQQAAPRLAAQGRSLGAGGSPPEILRQAFLSQAPVQHVPSTFPQARAQPSLLPTLPKPTPRIDRELQKQWARAGAVADRMVKAGLVSPERMKVLRGSATPEAFRQALTAEALKPKRAANFQGTVLTAAPVQAPKETPKVPVEVLVRAREQHKAAHRVEALVEKLARQGAIPENQVGRLSKMGSVQAVQAAVRALIPAKPHNYSGGWNQDPLRRQAVFAAQKSRDEASRAREQERKQAMDQLRAKVGRLQKAATRGEDLQSLIPRLFSDLEKRAAQRAIDLIVSRAAAPMAQAEANPYAGKVYTAHQTTVRASYEDHTLASAQRWVAQQMHLRGDNQFLEQELGRRFASVARDPSLVQLRKKHAGAGSVYIDAATFASPTGVAGCEQAAGTFRTASAKYVIAMDRCRGCSHRNAHGDCRKYRRPLVASVEDISQ